MPVRLLGLVEFEADKGSVRLRSGKQRALLAFLALQDGGVVTSSQLIDALWGDCPPNGGAKTLRFHISKLRAALARVGAAETLVTRVGGYALNVTGDDVDANHFRRLVEQARREPGSDDAIHLLEVALAMWRGPALADVANEPFALGEVARLEELRAAAEDDLLAALLERGEEDKVIAEAERLLGRTPFRERRWELLITALYRAGRQTDALAAFQRVRTALIEEVGVDPSPSLRDLESRVLNHDRGLRPPVVLNDGDGYPSRLTLALPSPLATASTLPFTGRHDERELLATRWKSALAGDRQVVLVAGEAGIGKTRLISELACAVHADGAVVALGRCDEELGDPYLPFAEALRHLVGGLPDAVIEAHIASAGAYLARLVPTILQRQSGASLGAAVTGGEPAAERQHLFDAVSDIVTRVARREPLLFVLEDLHWADGSSVLLLRYLMRVIAEGSLTIVGTYRPSDVAQEHPLAAWLADLRREPEATRIELDGLSAVEVVALIEAVVDRDATEPDRSFARALQSDTDGNPFFIGEILQHLRHAGAVRTIEGAWHGERGVIAELGIPQGVRDGIGRRLGSMPAETVRVLSVASVLGSEVTLPVLAELAGHDDLDALVDRLATAGVPSILVEVPGEVDRYRFTHALVRQTLYERIPTSRRVRLHAKAGALLGDRGAPAAVVARHFEAAIAVGFLDQALEWHRRAAEEAQAGLAYEQAVVHLRAAADIAARRDPPDPGQHAELMVELGTAMNLCLDVSAAQEVLADAVARAEDAGRDDLVVAAGLEFGGTLRRPGVRARRAGEGDEVELDGYAAHPLLARVAEIVGPDDSPERARLLLNQANWLPLDAPDEERTALLEAARAMAERVGEVKVLVTALAALFDPDKALEDPYQIYAAADAVDAAARDGGRGRVLAGRIRLGAHLRMGRLREALAEHQRMRDSDPAHRFFMPTRYTGAVLDVLRGEVDSGEETFEWLARREEFGAATGYAAWSALGIITWLRGRPADHRGAVHLAARASQGVVVHRPWAAMQAGRRGAGEDFVRHITDWLDNHAELEKPFRRAESAATVSPFVARTRRRDLCERLDDLLRPFSGQWLAYMGMPWGATDHYRAVLARGMGDGRVAEGFLRGALADYEREEEGPWRAHATVELAGVLLERAGRDAVSEAAALLQQADEAAGAMDLPGVRRRAAKLRTRT